MSRLRYMRPTESIGFGAQNEFFYTEQYACRRFEAPAPEPIREPILEPSFLAAP